VYNKDYFYDELSKEDFLSFDKEFQNEFEYCFDLFRVVDAHRIKMEDIDGLLIVEESMDFRVIFLDRAVGDYSIISRHIREEKAIEDFQEIKNKMLKD
jgi:hypothetical protein